MNENDSNKLQNYEIRMEKIPEEVLELPNKISSVRKSLLEKKYGDISKFCYTLFYLWFIEKRQKREIAEIFNNKPVNIHENLYNFRWHYSQDYVENQLLAKKEHDELEKISFIAREKVKNSDYQKNPIIQKAMETKLQIDAFTKHGFKTKKEYVLFLYVLIFELQMQTREIAIIFDESIGNTHSRVQTLGFNRSHSEGINIKKLKKSQNYVQSINRGRISRLNNQTKDMTFGSINEDFVRTQLSLRIFEFINSERFDIVIGISNTGNIGAREIDIPIMIWDNDLQKIFRLAIEYNGEYFHQNKNDVEKRAIAEKRGWVYIPIIETSSDSFNNDKNKLINVSIDICEKIKSIVI